MLKIIKYSLWVAVILALALGFDQLMINVPMNIPGLEQTQKFYVDFRRRLQGLVEPGSAPQTDTIEKMIEKSAAPLKQPATRPTRYLYVDGNGVLQFADSLQQVPAKYRRDAQPLAE